VSERILCAKLHSQQINISVIVAYAPTDGADEGDKDSFYTQLADTFADLPGHDIKLLLGDFNSKVTSDYTTRRGVIGRHSLHSESSDNGIRLLDFCALNQLTIGGTLFEHKDIHKGTWRSPDGRTVNQIDHICISTKWSHSLLDVKACRGADIGSDHYLVRGYLRIRLKAAKKLDAVDHTFPAIEHLRDGTKAEEYNIELTNRFECLYVEDEPLEDTWEKFKETVHSVSLEVLGDRPRKRRQQHLSQETKDLIRKRAEVKRRDPTSDTNKSEYSRLNKMVKKSCKVDDNNWALRVASDLESAAKQGNQREVWQKIRILSNKRSKKSSAVRDKSGKLISDPDAQRERWAEHFSELLNPQQEDSDLTELDRIPGVPSFAYLGEDDGPPTTIEIQNALKKLKNHKSPGVDGIANEQLKYGASGLIKALEVLFAKVWFGEAIPEDWSKGIIIVLPKKGDTTYCGNNRGITLRSTASKLFQIIILERINLGLERLLRENQCGFRKNRSCIDQIYSLQTIIHKSIEFNIPLYINFIDFKAAFDSIKRQFIWKAFSFYGLPMKYIRVLQAFFYNTVSAVRVNGEQSSWFNVESGTGQGDIQGPPVFNVCINLAAYLTEQRKRLSTGAVLLQETPGQPAVSVLDTDYADDMALLDNTKPGLQETTDLLCKNSSLAGLKANAKKTQVMAVGKHTTQRPYTEEGTLSVTVEGCPAEQVSTFTYLGTTFSSDGKMDTELSLRIQKASGAFSQLGKIWNNSSILLSTKIRIYEAAVLTILTYGSEVWVTTKAQMSRLEVFHQRCLRRILRVRWFHHVSNISVFQQTETTNIEAVVAASRLRWLGHVLRMPNERLPRFLLDWNPNFGKRSRGRPRKTWLNTALEDTRLTTGNNNLKLNDVEKMAQNRLEWRRMVRRRRKILDAGHSTGGDLNK